MPSWGICAAFEFSDKTKIEGKIRCFFSPTIAPTGNRMENVTSETELHVKPEMTGELQRHFGVSMTFSHSQFSPVIDWVVEVQAHSFSVSEILAMSEKSAIANL
jgi:hypothetical protein